MTTVSFWITTTSSQPSSLWHWGSQHLRTCQHQPSKARADKVLGSSACSAQGTAKHGQTYWQLLVPPNFLSYGHIPIPCPPRLSMQLSLTLISSCPLGKSWGTRSWFISKDSHRAVKSCPLPAGDRRHWQGQWDPQGMVQWRGMLQRQGPKVEGEAVVLSWGSWHMRAAGPGGAGGAGRGAGCDAGKGPAGRYRHWDGWTRLEEGKGRCQLERLGRGGAEGMQQGMGNARTNVGNVEPSMELKSRALSSTGPQAPQVEPVQALYQGWC